MDLGAWRTDPRTGKWEAHDTTPGRGRQALRLDSSLPAVPESVTLIRHAVADLAADAGIDGEQLDAIRLAVSEAATNTVLYAYGSDDGEIHTTAEFAGDELWVLIADHGRGIDAGPQSRGLGLGLALMSEVCDGFTVIGRAGGGTELQLCFKLRRTAEGGRRNQLRDRVHPPPACRVRPSRR